MIDNKEQLQIENEQYVNDNKIFQAITGSISYGLINQFSDEDQRGIYIAKKEQSILPFDKKLEALTFRHGDIVFYELSKFTTLCISQNPLILEILWGCDSDIIYSNNNGKLLRDNRQLLLCSKLKNSSLGKAEAEYNNLLLGKITSSKRKNMIHKYGYDVKSATQIIRILIMCSEAIETGTITLKNNNTNLLLKIKNGNFSLNEFTEIFNSFKDNLIKQKNNLPTDINMIKIKEILLEIYFNHWKV